MIRFMLMALFFSTTLVAEAPPTEQSFRFLVVGENGKPADGVPFLWTSELANGVDKLYGGRTSKVVARKVLLSANGGVVDIPKHAFSHFQISIWTDDLKNSAVWMVDSKTNSQYASWEVNRIKNPETQALGPPTPGFDAVFKVLSKKGISNLIRYNARHNQVPCDGTPTPLRVLGGPSAEVKNPEEADVVVTIKRPDQEIFSKESGKPYFAKPLRVPWVLESKTLRFAHFASDTDLSADYRHRTWTSRLEIRPTHPDHETSEGWQKLRLWAMIPGEKPLVVPLKWSVGFSFDSQKINKIVYEVGCEVILPLAPCTRYHPDMLSIEHYRNLAPEISGEAINVRLNPIRAAALAHPFPANMTTAPVLRYDTNPNPHGEVWEWRTLPVLLPSDKP